MSFRINKKSLERRIAALAEIGATKAGAVTRLTLSEEDKKARDLVTSWMKELGLEVKIDAIGNIFGLQPGEEAPVLTGSHIDSVNEGGKLDGPYGIVAGLEVINALQKAGIRPARPLGVAIFTNEEGVRFQPDMMGSCVMAGGLSLKEALATKDASGISLREALKTIGYDGPIKPGEIVPHAFVELHIEQGPVLENGGISIGVVENLTGINWLEVTIEGIANHAGTTPMDLRLDAGFAASRLSVFLNDLCKTLGHGQRATVGRLDLTPNAINVVPGRAVMTVDLRNPDPKALKKARKEFENFLKGLESEGFGVGIKTLVEFSAVQFDAGIVSVIEAKAGALGLSHRRMTSGAGHDAQMMARICPAAMIFVPSEKGISHNGKEFTKAEDLAAGADVLLHTLLELAEA